MFDSDDDDADIQLVAKSLTARLDQVARLDQGATDHVAKKPRIDDNADYLAYTSIHHTPATNVANSTTASSVPVTASSKKSSNYTDNLSQESSSSSSSSSTLLRVASDTTRRDYPANPRPNPISEDNWYDILQEENVVSAKGKSEAKRFPKIWSMVTHLVKYWHELGWETITNAKNATDFKRRIVRHIVLSRRRCMLSSVDSSALKKKFANKKKVSSSELVFYYGYHDFLNHASETWKVDKAAAAKKNLPTTNDKLRIFGILGMECNRDDVMKLARGKAMERADMDNALSMQDQVFYSVAQQFNDMPLAVVDPEDACKLDSYAELNPNDPERTIIKRDYKWVKAIYYAELKIYHAAMVNWLKGTGGGSGAPENYCNHNERDTCLFGGYHPSAGKSDGLAYIYMIDKRAGFIFDLVNDPPPQDSVYEDGMGSNKKPAKARRGGSSEMEDFAAAMSDAMNNVSKVLEVALKPDEPEEDFYSHAKTLDLIMLLQQQKAIASKDDNATRRLKRVKIFEAALDRAFDKLAEE